MRIAFFSDTYLPNVDGVVSILLAYRKELEKRGHEVFIFCPGTKKQKLENKDKNVYYFTSTSFKPYPDYRIALFPFFSAVRRVKESNIDIIHSHGIATTGLAAIQCSKKLNIPAIASFHTLIPEAVHYLTKQPNLQDIFKSIAWKYLKWYYPQFRKIIVPTNYIKNILEEQKLSNLVVTPAGVNKRRFHSKLDGSTIRKRYRLGKAPVITHVGRVALEKRLEILIESAPSILNMVPNAKFLIVGKGPAEKHYKDLVKEKDLSSNFIFTGYVEDELLPNIYAASDVLVFPSVFDTQGLVVMEALSTGTPVISQENSASAEFIKNGKNGYLFSDHFDLPDKVISALKNKENLRKEAIKESKNYSLTNSVDALVELYESMISSP